METTDYGLWVFFYYIFWAFWPLFWRGSGEKMGKRHRGRRAVNCLRAELNLGLCISPMARGLLILALCAVCSSVRSLWKPTLLLRMLVEPDRAYNKTSSPCFVWCLLWYVSSQECLTPAGKMRYSTQTFPRRSAKMPCWFCLGNQCWITFRWGRIFSPHLAVQSDVLTLVSDVSLCIVIWTVHLFNNVDIL